MTGKIHHFDEIESLAKKYPELKNGCLVDTNILISASLPIDPFNERAEVLISKLSALGIPLYTNVNIRSEFLEIYRRVLIPESLCDFLDDAESELDDIILSKLRSVRTSYRKSLDAGKVYKFTDDRIKEFRELLSSRSNEANGWEIFCQTYFFPQISSAWADVVEQCQIQSIKLRENEQHPLISGRVTWDGVIDIMGNYGLSSADSMIINLLLNSSLKFIITSDGDIKSITSFLGEHQKEIISLI